MASPTTQMSTHWSSQAACEHHYAYSRLTQPQEIRIISIESSPDAWPLRCRIQHVDLNSAGYDALSYVWNEPNSVGPHMPILCDEGMFIVTPNLHDALRTIWAAFPTQALWADQICINQASELDKNHQVATMSSIYKRASRSSQEDDDDVPRLARSISRLKEAKDITGRTWFRRIWTLQEIVMATQALLWCGDECADWDEYIAHHEGILQNLAHFLPTHFTLLSLNFLREAKTNSRGSTWEKLTLSELVLASQKRQATDPRDKVFALLGLMNEQNILTADYTMSIEDVYITAANYCIEQEKDLRILRVRCKGLTGNRKLPSWVPDLASGHATFTRVQEKESTGDTTGELPFGWDQSRTKNGSVYFRDHNSRTTTWIAPRRQQKTRLCSELQAGVHLHPDYRCIAIEGAMLGTVHGFVSNLEIIRRSEEFLEASSQRHTTLRRIWDGRYNPTSRALLQCSEAGMKLVTTAAIKPYWAPVYPYKILDTLDVRSRQPQKSDTHDNLAPNLFEGADQTVVDAFQRERWVHADARDDDVVCILWGKLQLITLRPSGIGANVAKVETGNFEDTVQYYEIVGESQESIVRQRVAIAVDRERDEDICPFILPMTDSSNIVNTVFHLR